MYIRQLEPPFLSPSVPHDFGRDGGGGAKGVFVCRRICHDEASGGGRTDAATVARGGGEEQWRRSLRQRQRRWNEVKASSQFVRQRRWRIRFLLPRSVVVVDNTKFLTQFHILTYLLLSTQVSLYP